MVFGAISASLKKHPSLIPLFVCVGVGVAAAGLYTLRLATKSPDVSWKKREKLPNEEYANKQYKFYSPGGDAPITKAPKYEE